MSSLSCGIVGLSNVGKSTLFNALTSRRLAETAPRPFTTIEPHEAVVPVADGGLEALCSLIKSGKCTPATVTFIDIAGLIKGAHQGEGLGNQFLAKIKEVDAVIHVVRAFYAPQVVRSEEVFELGSFEQIKHDVEIVNLELELGGITAKPTLVVLNVGEDDVNSPDTRGLIVRVTEETKTDTLAISAKVEEELIDFEKGEKIAYLKETGIEEVGLDRLVKKAYELLDLITFYTIKGGQEVRAWSLVRGKNALNAAEKGHTDFARNFIKAEAISIDQLLDFGGWAEAKEKGKVRLEGRDYIVKDGDVIEFKIGT